jgi:hypothetical protein
MKFVKYYVFAVVLLGLCTSASGQKLPVVVITDCYHPYQDPGDNLDLIMAYALPDVELLGIVLDITDSFRKDTADHPTLWKDPRGPREAGVIPILQLNYIFNKNIPFAVGPMTMMKSEQDDMRYSPAFEQEGVALLLKTLRESPVPVEILSFGSARVLSVAFNREPELLKKKISRIHLSGGTASRNYVLGQDKGANMIPGGEWNVALDVYAFTRLLKSGLPLALYPCAGKDGGFVKDVNSSYYTLHDMSFLKEMHPMLQQYIDFAFGARLSHDFLRSMDTGASYTEGKKPQFDKFHVWESAIWLNATGRKIVKSEKGKYRLIRTGKVDAPDALIENGLRPCVLTETREDGRFQFEYTTKKSATSIYFRPDMEENEAAMNAVIPELFKSFKP